MSCYFIFTPVHTDTSDVSLSCYICTFLFSAGGPTTFDSSVKFKHGMDCSALTDTGSGVTSSVEQIKMAGLCDTLL